MTISQDGRSLIWSCFSDSPHRLSQAHNDVVYQIDIDTLGTRLLAGSFDSTATVWDLRQGQCETVYSGHHAEVVAVDLSDDGSTAATLDATGILQVWDASNGKELFHIQPESGEFARHIGRSGGGLKANVLNFPAVMSTGIFSPDGLHVVAFNETNMKVYHSRTGNIEVVLDGATSSGWPIFSHDSSLVAVLEMNAKTAGVWDLNTGELVARLKGQREYLVMMDFSPIDQRLVTCAMEGKVVIWDARAGRQLHVLEDQTGNAVSCRFSTDGRFILVGYADSTVRIWESLTGKLVTTLIGHSDRIRDVRMSSDQTRLLSWAMDNKAIIWDFAQPLANQLLVQGGDSKLLQAHWSPDGKNIFTAWSSGRIEVWSGAAKSDFTKLVDRKGSFKDEFDKWRKQYMNCLFQ
jgi:WD40 repeat protein